MGIRALLGDLGVECAVTLNTDASAAVGIESRRGLGKIRHIEVSQLWLQQRVANGDLIVQDVDGISNLADALTTHLGRDALLKHMDSVGLEIRAGRHSLMPKRESADDPNVGVAVDVDDGEHLMQMSLATSLVRCKGLQPKNEQFDGRAGSGNTVFTL